MEITLKFLETQDDSCLTFKHCHIKLQTKSICNTEFIKFGFEYLMKFFWLQLAENKIVSNITILLTFTL